MCRSWNLALQVSKALVRWLLCLIIKSETLLQTRDKICWAPVFSCLVQEVVSLNFHQPILPTIDYVEICIELYIVVMSAGDHTMSTSRICSHWWKYPTTRPFAQRQSIPVGPGGNAPELLCIIAILWQDRSVLKFSLAQYSPLIATYHCLWALGENSNHRSASRWCGARFLCRTECRLCWAP